MWCHPVNDHYKQHVKWDWVISRDLTHKSHIRKKYSISEISNCSSGDSLAVVQLLQSAGSSVCTIDIITSTPSHCHITPHSWQCVFVYSVCYWCFWQYLEYCITGVPVWVHTEVENAVPSKVTVARQGVSGNGNLRSCCLLAVSRLSTKPTSPPAPCGLSLSTGLFLYSKPAWGTRGELLGKGNVWHF